MFGTSVLFLGVGRGRQPGCHRMREAAGSRAGVRLGTARLGPPRPLPPTRASTRVRGTAPTTHAQCRGGIPSTADPASWAPAGPRPGS